MIVKIFINTMRTQNILNFYGEKFDLKLDNSEFYDYQLTNLNDYEKDILDFSTPKNYLSLLFDSSCLINPLDEYKPLIFEIEKEIILDDCNFTIQSRTEKGWTLDFVFNRGDISWYNNNVFYYWGIENENNLLNYADNNLSFSFTSEGEIMWEKISYSGYCETDLTFTPTFYHQNGKTPPLCINDLTQDFNITITFKRYNELKDCEFLNDGGLNDLITEYTVTNPLNVLSGSTPNYNVVQELNQNWLKQKNMRSGVLKIFHNGVPIYEIENWEEIIPSKRNTQNSLVQIWGGGTNISENFNIESTYFSIKSLKYTTGFSKC